MELEAWSEGRDDDVLRVLDASYEDTLDCPGLRGLRDTADILAGHRGTGAFEPELWTILRVDDEPVGVLLLNRSPSNNTLELVYTGLARRVQGRGLGRLLLRHGLHRVGGRPERAVTLAVDDRNAPAISLYRGEGFRRVLRRAGRLVVVVPGAVDLALVPIEVEASFQHEGPGIDEAVRRSGRLGHGRTGLQRNG